MTARRPVSPGEVRTAQGTVILNWGSRRRGFLLPQALTALLLLDLMVVTAWRAALQVAETAAVERHGEGTRERAEGALAEFLAGWPPDLNYVATLPVGGVWVHGPLTAADSSVATIRALRLTATSYRVECRLTVPWRGRVAERTVVADVRLEPPFGVELLSAVAPALDALRPEPAQERWWWIP